MKAPVESRTRPFTINVCAQDGAASNSVAIRRESVRTGNNLSRRGTYRRPNRLRKSRHPLLASLGALLNPPSPPLAAPVIAAVISPIDDQTVQARMTHLTLLHCKPEKACESCDNKAWLSPGNAFLSGSRSALRSISRKFTPPVEVQRQAQQDGCDSQQ